VLRAREGGVRFMFGAAVTGLEREDQRWIVNTARGALHTERVIVATGGLSVPATGSDGVGLRLVEAQGHRVHPVYPALTPLVAEPAVHEPLSGISLQVRLRARAGEGKIVEAGGGFLFTHRGYSGPAVLDVSHVATRNPGAVVRVRWSAADPREWEDAFVGSSALVSTIVSRQLPQRLAAQLLTEAGVSVGRRADELRRTERIALIDALTSYTLPWTGHEGFKKAEVTGGGVALDEVDPRSLESRRTAGLFLCGEILDAFGPIGGHNFAWAWATGRLAGLGAGGRG
jgi:predicted Rossmann fold flavoprotein